METPQRRGTSNLSSLCEDKVGTQLDPTSSLPSPALKWKGQESRGQRLGIGLGSWEKARKVGGRELKCNIYEFWHLL